MRTITLLLPLCSLLALAMAGPEAPSRLRVEYMENPQGVALSYAPRLTWALEHSERGEKQTAYRVVVEQTHPQVSTVWDSGKIASNVSQNVHIGGDSSNSSGSLPAGGAFRWRVMFWDSKDQPSPWSANATFSTGLYTEADWQGAAWIGNGAMGLMRKSFGTTASTAITRATAYVVGLGYYKLYVDGIKVSDHQLGAFTTYATRVYYDTWDITDAMNAHGGSTSHAVGVHLGNGWYTLLNVGTPVLRLLIVVEYADGSTSKVVSGTDWQYAPGPVTAADIYNGETYNATMEKPGWTEGSYQPDADWVAAKAASPPSPNVTLTSHAVLPPIRIGEDYTPCNMYASAPGVYVYDFCQNMAGIITLRIPEGVDVTPMTEIQMLHAEAVHGPPPASIFHHYGNTKEINTYITRGDGAAAKYTTQFVYAGFRYVQLTGFPGTPDYNTLTAHFIHTDYELSGSIAYSDAELNQVQHITRTAAMSNFQSIPTDCPQRERRGWLGDAQLSAETNMYNFDMGAPYTSFVQQINDAQDPKTGSVPDCVPYYGHGQSPADPAWGGAYTFIADWVGTYYHDDQIFREHYEGIRAHLEELISTAAGDNMDGLLSYSGWGDWCPPSGCAPCWPGTPDHHNSALVSSFYYLSELRIVARYAGILGKSADQQRYSQMAASVGEAFNKHFYDAANKTYNEPGRTCNEYLSPQTMISLAATLDLIPEADYDAVIDTMVEDIASHGYHLNVGIVGIKYLLTTLSAAGRGDVALMILQARTPPSYIYMVEQGATTLWETWTGTRYSPTASWNHIMFGSGSSEWPFKFLAGLRMQGDSRGWQQLELQPQVWNKFRGVSICANLSSVAGSISTARGRVSGAWSCGGSYDTCDVAEEHATAKLSCSSGGTISGIVFASFGTPVGDCSAGLAMGTCNANSTAAIVEKACVGKPSCSVPVEDSVFGDPCFDTKKVLAVAATCTHSSVTQVFQYNVTVPVGSTANVHLPFMGRTNPSVIEGGSGHVWNNGAYVPGVAGVTGASKTDTEIVVSCGSGSYSFSVWGGK